MAARRSRPTFAYRWKAARRKKPPSLQSPPGGSIPIRSAAAPVKAGNALPHDRIAKASSRNAATPRSPPAFTIDSAAPRSHTLTMAGRSAGRRKRHSIRGDRRACRHSARRIDRVPRGGKGEQNHSAPPMNTAAPISAACAQNWRFWRSHSVRLAYTRPQRNLVQMRLPTFNDPHVERKSRKKWTKNP